MSPPCLPFGSFLAGPAGTGSPPCPPIWLWLWRSLPSGRARVGMFTQERLIPVTKRCGCRASWAGGVGTRVVPSTDAEAPSARRGCWEGRQDLVDLHFPGIILLRWSLGVALTYSQGLGFSLTPCRILGRRNPGEGSCV